LSHIWLLTSPEQRGSGWIVGGVVGGACIPPLLAKVADDHNSTAFAMVVPVVVFVAAYPYALAVNFVPSYRDPADKIGDSDLGLDKAKDSQESDSGEEKTNISEKELA
jgi:FHS family L-fucose permease-like MFS transporter